MILRWLPYRVCPTTRRLSKYKYTDNTFIGREWRHYACASPDLYDAGPMSNSRNYNFGKYDFGPLRRSVGLLLRQSLWETSWIQGVLFVLNNFTVRGNKQDSILCYLWYSIENTRTCYYLLSKHISDFYWMWIIFILQWEYNSTSLLGHNIKKFYKYRRSWIFFHYWSSLLLKQIF